MSFRTLIKDYSSAFLLDLSFRTLIKDFSRAFLLDLSFRTLIKDFSLTLLLDFALQNAYQGLFSRAFASCLREMFFFKYLFFIMTFKYEISFGFGRSPLGPPYR